MVKAFAISVPDYPRQVATTLLIVEGARRIGDFVGTQRFSSSNQCCTRPSTPIKSIS